MAPAALLAALFAAAAAAAAPKDASDEEQNAHFAGCQFPDSLQGLYRRQDDTNPPTMDALGLRSPIQYEDFFIGPTAIPHWGDCAQRQRDSYVLALKKVGGFVCFRCFSIARKTASLLQVITAKYARGSLLSECGCGTGKLRPCYGPQCGPALHHALECGEAGGREKEYCPIGGQGRVGFEGGDGRLSCPLPSPSAASTLSNCRRGNQLQLHLRGCNLPLQSDSTFDCLGSWPGPGGERFFALYNVDAEEFRCGMLSEEEASDGAHFVYAALSNDSSCHSRLISPRDGYEVFRIQKSALPPWPLSGASACVFPEWARGDWEVLTVGEELVSYFNQHDPSTMSTQYARCVRVHGETIHVLTRNHCGESVGYRCLWFKRRSESVLELKMGADTSVHFDPRLCEAADTFDNTTWTTIASRSGVARKTCPHLGRFSTAVETPEGHCFEASVPCEAPDILNITASTCATGTVFQSESYECMGSWEEGGTTFSYVRRLGDGSKGCWASKVELDGRLSLAWTGKDCRRSFDFYAPPPPSSSTLPTLLQLKLQEPCLDNSATTSTTVAEDVSDSVGNISSPPVFRVRPPKTPPSSSSEKVAHPAFRQGPQSPPFYSSSYNNYSLSWLFKCIVLLLHVCL